MERQLRCPCCDSIFKIDLELTNVLIEPGEIVNQKPNIKYIDVTSKSCKDKGYDEDFTEATNQPKDCHNCIHYPTCKKPYAGKVKGCDDYEGAD